MYMYVYEERAREEMKGLGEGSALSRYVRRVLRLVWDIILRRKKFEGVIRAHPSDAIIIAHRCISSCVCMRVIWRLNRSFSAISATPRRNGPLWMVNA